MKCAYGNTRTDPLPFIVSDLPDDARDLAAMSYYTTAALTPIDTQAYYLATDPVDDQLKLFPAGPLQGQVDTPIVVPNSAEQLTSGHRRLAFTADHGVYYVDNGIVTRVTAPGATASSDEWIVPIKTSAEQDFGADYFAIGSRLYRSYRGVFDVEFLAEFDSQIVHFTTEDQFEIYDRLTIQTVSGAFWIRDGATREAYRIQGPQTADTQLNLNVLDGDGVMLASKHHGRCEWRRPY